MRVGWVEAAMDGKAFEAWLGAVRMLTAEQRGQGFAALALAEADAAEDVECLVPSAGAVGEQPTVVGLVAGGSDREALKVNRSETASAPPVSPSAPVVVAARSRVESTGCPHCGGRRLQRWGRASGLPRYRCGNCRRTFNGLTRTPMARLRKKEVWAEQAKALMTGESLVKAAERCGVADTTAFRWRHRFLSAPALDKPNRLSGIVEADETFIRESFKGKRIGLPRPARKRGGKAAKRGLSAEQIPVLVARDRTGATTDAVLPKLSLAVVTTALGGVVTPANHLCCDGGKAIVGFARRAQIPCHILPVPGSPRPEAPDLHINNVNSYHGRLKEWLRPFHGVATRYLDHYLGWRRTVEALGAIARPEVWLRNIVGLGPYQQQTR
jgi:transposase-like protein